MADPLNPFSDSTPSNNSYQSHVPHPDSNLSSVPARAPLPGYDRDYRNPGLSTSQSASNSARQTGHVDDDAWGNPHQRNHLIARGPQNVESPIGRRRAESEGDNYGRGEENDDNPKVVVPQEGFVRIRILGIDRNRRDMYIKFNAESNLPTFRNSTYRAISRSYTEFTSYVSALSVTCPQSIIPALPLPQTSAATDEEDDRLMKQLFQKWCVRLMQDQAVVRDEETRSFVESDFGYTPNHKKKSSTAFPSFSRSSRGGELDDPLTLAKISMSRLETSFLEGSKTVEKCSKSRRQCATMVNELGDQVNTFAMSETYQPLAVGFKRLARSFKVDADIMAVQSISEVVNLGDALLYQSTNARSAKETLSNRDSVSEDHRNAVKLTIQKRRNIEKLRSSNKELRSEKVDEALEELDEAKRNETLLTARLSAISSSLSPSLARHSVQTHTDLLQTLLDHSKANLIYEKQRLKEFETLRGEMKNIRKIEGGVHYHHQHQQQQQSPTRTRGVLSTATSPLIGGHQQQPRSKFLATTTTSSAPMSPSPSNTSSNGSHSNSRPNNGGGGNSNADPLSAYSQPGQQQQGGSDLSSMAQRAPQKRTVRSMASSVVVEGDRRQRVDARMAASMLANGF